MAAPGLLPRPSFKSEVSPILALCIHDTVADLCQCRRPWRAISAFAPASEQCKTGAKHRTNATEKRHRVTENKLSHSDAANAAIVLALVIWVATVTSRGHPEKRFSKIIPPFSAKIFLKIAPALANHGHSRYELLHLNPRRQGHKDLCGRLFLKGELYCNERTQDLRISYDCIRMISAKVQHWHLECNLMQLNMIWIEDACFWGTWGT